ncbi:putative threonylcarbamoyl-AMP synthase [Merluccius polli]|uniref:Threonylcarbamoyl-AMP synthase n=1 Tax=Merluccius polli TaxID=89951 RepID=A0AA47N8V9_MERPO|nr:putative threonylcarbamoyl-AMP synthase [Merluccius polli]
MNALVVTSLFFTSTWASPTFLFTCLQPISFMTPAVPAKGHLREARQGLGGQHGGDAAHSLGFACLVESLDEPLYLGLDGVVLPLHRPVAQVLDFAPGDTCALLQDVALPVCGLPLTVVHHMHLICVWSEHLHLVRCTSVADASLISVPSCTPQPASSTATRFTMFLKDKPTFNTHVGICLGSLLLLVNSYASTPGEDFIPKTALGILLLVIAAVLAYAGVLSLSHGQPFSLVCLTVSGLWCGSGLVYILAGQGVLRPEDLTPSLVPGLAAFTLALLLIAIVAVLAKRTILSIIALGISLACAHQIASLSEAGFGQAATAANYLLVCLVGVYFGVGRLLSYITHGEVELPATWPKEKSSQTQTTQQDPEWTGITLVSLVMNLLAACVLACPLLGVVPQLSVGHVPWLWTAGVFQLGTCVLSYRAMDTLAATFSGFMAVLRFAEGYSALLTLYSVRPDSPAPLPAVFSALLFVSAAFACQKSLLEGLYQLFFVAYCVAVAVEPRGFLQGGAQGVQAAIFVASAGVLYVYALNMHFSRKIPTGQGLAKALVSRVNALTLRPHDKDLHAPYLGSSKYADAEVLGHACSALAAFAVTATVGDRGALGVPVLPWAVVAGGALQLLCGFVCFSRGKTFESTAFVLYGVMWTVWGLTRYGGLYGESRGFNVAVGIICFMLFNVLVTVAALFLNVAWFAYALTFQLILISFLLDALGSLPYGYDIGVTIIFGLVSFYCFLAHLFNSTFQSPQIPLGQALVKLSGTGGSSDVCPHVPARKAASVHQIAEIMKNGGICGMPTDTVYVLVAACNRPDAVVKAFKVKKQAQDRPMSLWISSIKQLEPVKHLLSPLLLEFMQAAWPSSISMVIPRGPWLDAFGLGEAAKHIGTPQSIAIRNPDCTIATYLINMVGPIAVTSANPTGEADTTHHNQVYAKLGDKVNGVLCDGPSPENIASTVVDCTKIDTGHIGFFRVGLIPKSKVLHIFEEVQRRHMQGEINPAFEPNISDMQSIDGLYVEITEEPQERN